MHALRGFCDEGEPVMADETRVDDPRILTRSEWAQESLLQSRSAMGFEHGRKLSEHDLAQRERIATLEARVRELESAPGELEVWLCPPHRSLDDARALKPLDNCVACIRAERDELEADNRRLRELLKEFHELAKHLSIYTAGHRSRVESALQPAAPPTAALQPSPAQSGATDKESLQVQPVVQTCKTCGGKKRVMRVVKQYEDAYAEHSHLKFSDCPDCSGAATEKQG